MAKETPQQFGVSGQAASFPVDVGLDLAHGVRGEVREAAVLEIAPEQLDGIEIGRVGRKPHDVAARMRGQPGSYERVSVRTSAVPHHDEWPADMAREMAEEAQHLRAAHVAARVEGQSESDAPAPGRHDEGPDPGHLLVGASAHDELGRRAARRPRAADHRHHQEAGLIEADQMGAEAPEFFLPWPSRGESTPGHADHRALGLAAVVAAG